MQLKCKHSEENMDEYKGTTNKYNHHRLITIISMVEAKYAAAANRKSTIDTAK